ncbi:MAG TPA: hypothetical protein VLM91_09415 [Candidatus Methylomirabilis sp.]|nr:hypothetical protein [Candidatus Methylomirabilis sp.]
MPERSPHLLMLGPSDEPHWVGLVVQPIGEVWTAILAGAHEPPPEPGRLTWLCVSGKTPDEAKGAALPKLMRVAWEDAFRRTLGRSGGN